MQQRRSGPTASARTPAPRPPRDHLHAIRVLTGVWLLDGIANVQDEDQSFRKMKLRCEDVQGRNVLTNFWVRRLAQSTTNPQACHSGSMG